MNPYLQDEDFTLWNGDALTALVARRLGRRCIGIELSESYCQMAARRTQQLSMLTTEPEVSA